METENEMQCSFAMGEVQYIGMYKAQKDVMLVYTGIVWIT
jgi:hypothetical protein